MPRRSWLLARRSISVFVLSLFAVVSGSCNKEHSVTQPDGAASASCFLGAVPLPAQALCFTGKSGCPLTRPEGPGAHTLVGLATCDYGAGETPCAPKTLLCPLMDPHGNAPLRYLMPGGACPAVVDLLLQASLGDGGAGLEWRVQDYSLVGQQCVAKGSQRIGLASMPAACCATSVDIPVPERNRTFRLVARTDWIVLQ